MSDGEDNLLERAKAEAFFLWEGLGRPSLSKEDQDALFFQAMDKIRGTQPKSSKTSGIQTIAVEDHGKQIRTIHFALLTLTFGLIVVWMDRSPTDLALASKQAEEIESLLQSWDPLFLDSFARNRLIEDGIPEGFRPTTQIEVNVPNAQDTKAFAFSDRCWTLHPLPAPLRRWDASFQQREVRHRDFIHIEIPFLRGETFVPPPSKLSQFFELWDGLNQQINVNKPVDVSDTCFVHFVGGAKEWSTVKKTNLPDGSPLPKRKMLFRAPTDYESDFFPNEKQFAAKPYSHFFTGGFLLKPKDLRSQGEAELPVLTESRASINGQESLLQSSLEFSWKLGNAEESFPELYAATSDFQDLSLERITQILDSLNDQPTEQFEVFGTKIPTGNVVGILIPLIVGVQCYFLVHLVAFRTSFQNSSDKTLAPWIGFYDGTLATVVCTATAFLAAPSAIAVVAVSTAISEGGTFHWLVALFLILSSCVLAFFAHRALARIKEVIPGQDTRQDSCEQRSEDMT